MQPKSLGMLAAGLMVVLAAAGCSQEMYMTVTINGDGTARVTEEFVIDRAQVEPQLMRMSEGGLDDTEGPPEPEDEESDPGESKPATAPASPDAAKAEPAATGTAKAESSVTGTAEAAPAVTATGTAKTEPTGTAAVPGAEKKVADDLAAPDAKLEAAIRKMMRQQMDRESSQGGEFKIDSVEVGKETIRVRVSIAFKGLAEWVTSSNRLFSNIELSHMTLEKDEAGKLRMTLAGRQGGVSSRTIQELKSSPATAKLKAALKFVMPGKIVSSTLGEIHENETWIEVDATKPESFDALAKVLKEPIVIVAEPGTLPMAGLPLDSAKLVEAAAAAARKAEEAGAPPLTDAGPGFSAEALGITTTMIHVFPEGEKLAKDRMPQLLGERPGSTLQVNLYPPKGRTVLEVQGVRLVRAVDDQGREVKGPAEGNAGSSRTDYNGDSSGSRGRATRIVLNMDVPAAGAKTLAKVEGEAILTTALGQKEHAVSDLKADLQKEIDLGDLLPGAKMVITNVKDLDSNNANGQVAIKITGPKAIARIGFDVKSASGESFNAYHSMSSRESTGGETTANVTVQYSPIDRRPRSPAAEKPKLTLLLHVPADLKRERVKFTLETIDLF